MATEAVAENPGESGGSSAVVATDARAKESRIERIADMMRDGQWVRGKSGKALALELGVTYQTIRLDAAEASRRVYAEVMADREGIGAKVGVALGTALEGAIAKEDWKAVAQLSKVYADASGVSAPQKFEGVVGTASPADAARLIREKFGQHASKREPDAG